MDVQINKESCRGIILEFDIRRTIILNLYIKEWSMPEYRVITQGVFHCAVCLRNPI